MSDFGFEILLYKDDFNTSTIKPPSSLFNLKEAIYEKFFLTQVEIFYEDLDDERVQISDDRDYFDMFNYVDAAELKEIVIYVYPEVEEDDIKVSVRKNSKAIKPHPNFGGISGVGNEDDDNLNDFMDSENAKDLRNLKYNNDLNEEEGNKYSKHSYNKKNQDRIYYIKEKKAILKDESQMRQEEKRLKDEGEIIQKKLEEDEHFGKKNKNRKGNKVIK